MNGVINHNSDLLQNESYKFSYRWKQKKVVKRITQNSSSFWNSAFYKFSPGSWCLLGQLTVLIISTSKIKWWTNCMNKFNFSPTLLNYRIPAPTRILRVSLQAVCPKDERQWHQASSLQKGNIFYLDAYMPLVVGENRSKFIALQIRHRNDLPYFFFFKERSIFSFSAFITYQEIERLLKSWSQTILSLYFAHW